MEYTYEFLRKCHGLRFRATISNKPQEGIIKVMSKGVMLCYGEEDPGFLVTFGRRDTLSFSEQTFTILPSDFEIVPRDPETYIDWQVGDRVSMQGSNKVKTIIIFRSGELVIFKRPKGGGTWEGYNPYIRDELFEKGYRLVLTDIEKQIIEDKKPKWKPQDGDILTNEEALVIYAGTKDDGGIISYVGVDIEDSSSMTTEIGPGWGFSRDYRPATYEEKQQLFEALAEVGKRWNAEKKVVEDIKPEADEPENNNEPEDVQGMIAEALKGYTPKGQLEGFPVEIIAKMLERQYEQSGEINIEVFELIRTKAAPYGFNWDETTEGYDFWDSVIFRRDFPKFYKMYPKEKEGAAEESHTFKKFDPVLVRDGNAEQWEVQVFGRYGVENEAFPYFIIDGPGYLQCIPLNEKTEHLLGTSDNYEEEQS